MMELTPGTQLRLSELIHRLCGLVIGSDKAYLIHHRLEPLVHAEGLTSFEQFLDRLQSRDGARLHDVIIEAITTKETSFFRDREFFHALEMNVLPECVSALKRPFGRRHRIRIWSAGCATGQECYSVAMLIRELVMADGNHNLRESDFTILASDISAEALKYAKAGRYIQSEVSRGLSGAMLTRHFHYETGDWVAIESLRKLIHFRRFDLLNSPAGLGAFDVILCRNVLIYFDEPSRRRVCQRLYEVLQDGGWLALGSAENLYGTDERFEVVRLGSTLLYRKPHRIG